MAWVTKTALSSIADASAAALVRSANTQTHVAISDFVGDAIAGEVVAGSNVQIVEGGAWAAEVTTTNGVATFKFTVPPVAVPPVTPLGGTVDLNTYTATQRRSATVSTELASANLPATVRMLIDIVNVGSGIVVQEATALQEDTRWWRVQYGGTWRPWQRITNNVTVLSTANDYNTIKTPGTYLMVSGAPLGASTNMPEVARHILRVTGDASNYVRQEWSNLVTGRTWERSFNVTAWSAWTQAATTSELAAATAGASADAGLSNALLVQDWARRRGGRKRIAVAAVAMRFDHGLANFNTKLRPLLEARDLPYSLALCSGAWGEAENTGVTAAMVDGWVQAGLCEIWNHSRTHAGSESQAGWEAEIGTGLTELRAQIPSAQIDGFAVPGTAGVGYGDFDAGSTIAEFYETPAGRYILSTHAVSTGYIPGTAQRILDGVPRQGQMHSTLDTATLASVQSQVAAAQADKRGLQFMLHPNLVDSGGSYVTTAAFEGFLDHIVTERDAGRLVVLGPYDLMLADVE